MFVYNLKIEISFKILISLYSLPILVYKITTFKDPIRSSLIFLIIELALFLIAIGKYSFVSLISYIFMTTIILSCAFVYIGELLAMIKKEEKFENPLR